MAIVAVGWQDGDADEKEEVKLLVQIWWNMKYAVATFMAIVAVRWQDEDDDEKEESFSDVKMHKNEIFGLMKILPKN